MNQPYIVGWGHTPFGKLDNIELEQLIRDAALPAIESAGLEPADIDGIFVGHFGACCDPIPKIDVGQAEFFGLFDLP